MILKDAIFLFQGIFEAFVYPLFLVDKVSNLCGLLFIGWYDCCE